MNSIVIFLLFFGLTIFFSLLGFYIVRYLILHEKWEEHFTDESMSISGSILAALSIFISIPLTAIIIFLWTNYTNTVTYVQTKMDQLLIMYDTVKLLNDVKLKNATLLYIKNKINYNAFQNILYTYEDKTSIIYLQIIDMLPNVAFTMNMQQHVTTEIWLVIIVGVLSVIIGTWFVKSPILLHVYLIMSVSGVLGTLVFLVYYYNAIDCYKCITEQLRYDLIKKLK